MPAQPTVAVLLTVPSLPVIVLVGAPHTGTAALALALKQHVIPGRVTVVCAGMTEAPANQTQQPDLAGSPSAMCGQRPHPAGVSAAACTAPPASSASPTTWAEVTAAHRAATLTLLMGLDLPCPADERHAQETADQQLRTALNHAGLVYKVVYGQGEQRLANALIAIKNIAPSAYSASARGTFHTKTEEHNTRLRAWNCEKCSDPGCEHRLFTGLTRARSAPGA